MSAQEPASSHIWNYYTLFKVTVFEKNFGWLHYIDEQSKKDFTLTDAFCHCEPSSKVLCLQHLQLSYLILKAGILNKKFRICKVLKI